MAMLPLKLPPGVFKNGTEYQAKGRWTDSNLVRWFEGTIRPVGGWRKRSASQLTGKARGFISWRDNSGNRRMAVGTHSKLYHMNEGGTLTDITPVSFTTGDADAVLNIGYGSQTYGNYAYGVPRPDIGTYTPATTWSLDTWGEYLVGCSSKDGKLLEWQLNTGSDAVAITNAPTSCTAIVVTSERFLFALGAGGNPRKVQWSDQENNTVWTPATTNQAGDFELTTVGSIQLGKRIRNQLMIWTDVDAHVATYIGPPYVYSFEKVGMNCGVISKNAVAVNDNSAIWMSRFGFWIYDGYVKPLPSDVSDYVFNNININQSSKVYAVHNATYGEIWWFYPSAASNENDSYVTYNYREGHWATGSIARTCGADRDVFAYPLWVSADGYIYEHEVGFNYDSATLFAESGPVELGDGDNTLYLNGLIPDDKTLGDVQVRFGTKFYPTGTEYSYGPYSLANPTSFRLTGRQIAARIEGVRLADWRVGTIRLDGKQGGRR